MFNLGIRHQKNIKYNLNACNRPHNLKTDPDADVNEWMENYIANL